MNQTEIDKKLYQQKTRSGAEIIEKSWKGNLSLKLSYIIMGAANFASKQFVKGILFLIIEIGFISYMVSYGFHSLFNLITLGTQAQGWVMDDALGIKVQVQGDNSMLCMIYGLATILLILIFAAFYVVNVKSAYRVCELKQKGKEVPTIKEDITIFLDKKFHITLLSLPMISVLTFVVLPLLYMILLAFTNYDHNHLPPKNLFEWVGFNSFSKIFSSNIAKTFFPLLGWTLVWAFFATFTSFAGGVVITLLINKKGIRFKKVFRAIFVMTVAVPQFVSLLIMRNMLHASGPVNTLLQNWGLITQPLPFLTDALVAKLTVIVVNMWVGIPFMIIIITSVLTNLSSEQMEAARIDGASNLQLFYKITLPQIVFIMAPTLIQQFVGNINNFNIIYLLTLGAPMNSKYYGAGDTDLLITWLYKMTVEKADYNLASTIGIVTFLVSAVFSLITYTRSAAYSKEDMFQ